MLVMLHLIRRLDIIIAMRSTTTAITALCMQSHVVQRIIVPQSTLRMFEKCGKHLITTMNVLIAL
jgi:hypothetical protein